MLRLPCTARMAQFTATLLARRANANVEDLGGHTPVTNAVMHVRTKTFRLRLTETTDAKILELVGPPEIFVEGSSRVDGYSPEGLGELVVSSWLWARNIDRR